MEKAKELCVADWFLLAEAWKMLFQVRHGHSGLLSESFRSRGRRVRSSVSSLATWYFEARLRYTRLSQKKKKKSIPERADWTVVALAEARGLVSSWPAWATEYHTHTHTSIIPCERLEL